MRTEAQVPVGERFETAADHLVHRHKVAFGLPHAPAIHGEECAVHPHVGKGCSVRGLRLRDLVRVVNGDVINAAAVDVERLPEEIASHRGTFDVPPGEPTTPRCIPLHLALHPGRGDLPKCEVVRGTLFEIHGDTRMIE